MDPPIQAAGIAAKAHTLQRGSAAPPFFVITAPGISPLGYLFLARRLGPGRPVYGIEAARGRSLPQSAAEIQALASQCLLLLREIQIQGPYQLGGACGGAHIAFEMARQLTEAGQQVHILALFDTWVLENTRNRLWHLTRVSQGFKRLRGRSPVEVWQAGVRFCGRILRRGDRTPDPILAVYWPGEGFKPLVYSGAITVFRIRRQPYYRVRDYALGWRGRTTGPVQVFAIPGTHFTFLTEPHVEKLGRLLRPLLLGPDGENAV